MKAHHLTPLMIAAVTICGLASGDTIKLKSGAVFHGRVQTVDDDWFYLKIPNGKISFTYDEVEEIIEDTEGFESRSWKIKKTGTPALGGSASPEHAEGDLSSEEMGRYARIMASLEEANETGMYEGLNSERRAIIGALGEFGPRAAPYLEQSLRNASQESMPYVLRALVAAAPERGAQTAQEMSQSHPSSSVRATALALLAEKDADAYRDTFVLSLQDEQGGVRLAAAQGLGASKDPEVVPSLIEALEDPVASVRDAASVSLRTVTGEALDGPDAWTEWYDGRKSD